jgi:MATE family multidrug resistance protein
MAALSELRQQLRTSVPATLSMLLYRLPWLISLSFVGNIGSEELAAAALATTLCNVTGMSLSVGLSSALSTLAAQARGELMLRSGGLQTIKRRDEAWGSVKKLVAYDEMTPLSECGDGGSCHFSFDDSNNNDDDAKQQQQRQDEDLSLILPLVYLYRGIFIQLAFVIPVGLYWLHGIRPLLIHLGQGEELSIMTEQYLRILAPGLWGYSINFTLTTWLQVMELAHIPAYSALLGNILHIPMNILFIHVVGLGWLGVAVATTMFQVIQPIAMFAYLKGTQHGRQQLLQHIGAAGIGRRSLSFWCEAKAAISSIRGICQYISLAIPGVLTISEWWASEICIFLSGRLSPDPNIALGSMAIYQSLNSSCFMLPLGVSIGGTARIGNQLGAGNSLGARFSAKMCVILATILSSLMGSILYFTPHSYFPSFFTSDAALIEMTSRTIPLLSIYVIGDGMQVALNAIIKGCGRQIVAVPIVICSYWVVGLPLAWFLAFAKSGGTTDCQDQSLCGVVGLVGGMTVGTWCHFGLLAVYSLRMIDWHVEAKMAKDRLNLERGKSKSPVIVKNVEIA